MKGLYVRRRVLNHELSHASARYCRRPLTVKEKDRLAPAMAVAETLFRETLHIADVDLTIRNQRNPNGFRITRALGQPLKVERVCNLGWMRRKLEVEKVTL
jgi:hypothetical protein